MSLKIPRLSSLLYQAAINAALLEGAKIRLFKNDYVPVDTSVLADFTEANFTGYAEKIIAGWSAPALNVDNKAATEAPIQTFSVTGPATANTVYGIFVVSAAGALLYAERNPAGGVLLNTAGQTYSYIPRFTYRSEF